ncbi:ABC transporter substrate-binding protein [Egbenema bharatensis]|uniref:ABC transporter substrate-binding protein n=1 Tax=Egbenema bharatensis TaxID=3463334 RepID=UPI003A8AD27C
MMRVATLKTTLSLLFLSAIFTLIIAACNKNVVQLEGKQSSVTAVPSPIATQVVKHAFGQIEIPLHPQRVVVLDGSILLDPVLALGIRPVGVAPCLECFEDILGELTADISVVGNLTQPSLEKILSLKPDLILSHEHQGQIYPQLATIAPTVAMDSNSGIDFKRELRWAAEIFNQSDRAEKILSSYDNRIQQFREKLGTKLRNKTVSILHLNGSQISACGAGITTYGQVMSDAGLEFIQAYKDLKDGCSSISIETLSEWDADCLFVVVVYKRHGDLMSLSFLDQPIWSTLKAVQNKQVYSVNWASVGGPIGANWLIDELYKYFSDAP